MTLNIAVVGPKGSFSERAGLEFAGKDANFIYVKDPKSIFDLVEEDKKVNCGIVPVEDSILGDIPEVLDLFRTHDVHIVHELYLEVTYALLGKEDIDKLKAVGSHPRALELCRKYLDTDLPHLSRQLTYSTSEAARLASEDPTFGAIAGKHAAEIYGLNVLSMEVHDYGHHTTLFHIISKRPMSYVENVLKRAKILFRKDNLVVCDV